MFPLLANGVNGMKHLQKIVRMAVWTGIFAVGTYILIRGIGIMEESGIIDIHSLLEKMAVNTYMAGLTYEEKDEDKSEDWVSRIIGSQYPVYDYVKEYMDENQAIESSPEYQMMVEAEGEDSRQLDSDGHVAGKTSGDREIADAGKGENGKSQAESSQPQTADGQPQTGGGQPQTEGGQPQTEDGQPQTEGSQSQTEGGQPQTEDGKPQTEGGQTQTEGSEHKVQGGEEKGTENPDDPDERSSEESERPDGNQGLTETEADLADASAAGSLAGGGTAAGTGLKREPAAQLPMDQLQDFNFLLNNYFTLDMSTSIDSDRLNIDSLLGKDLSISSDNSKPQILIYHTHSQEGFVDSVPGDTSTTIVGVGERLAQLLRKEYGFNVIHHTAVYDLIDGELDRNKAYNLAAPDVQSILDANPSIEVVIDLHRDGVDGYRFVTDIDGKPTARIMFFNGLSYSAETGDIDYLPNPYVQDNLAFSFQLQMKAAQYYPGFTRNIYLKSLRFNLHMRPRSLLIESGTQLNTVQEELNAMEPLADILNQVLRGE